VQAQTNN